MIIVTGNGKIIYMGERVSVSLDRLIAWILKLICELVLLFHPRGAIQKPS
jgi:hypothetical protein